MEVATENPRVGSPWDAVAVVVAQMAIAVDQLPMLAVVVEQKAIAVDQPLSLVVVIVEPFVWPQKGKSKL